MYPGQTEILAALERALAARGFADARPQLAPIEPPRDWGLTTNVCFTLAGLAAQARIAAETAGLDKKEAKAKAAEITRAAGPALAAELAEELGNVLNSVAAAPSRRFSATSADDGGKVPPPQEADANSPLISRVEAEGAYLNFYFDPAVLAEQVVEQILRGPSAAADARVAQPSAAVQDDQHRSSNTAQPQRAMPPDGRYGAGAATGRRIMVEYAQPNTHKDFHVGHLRNASIGQAIASILEFAGNEVRKATYIGDVGAHVAKAIWGEQNGGAPDNSDALLKWQTHYRAGNSAAESNPSALQQQRDWLKEWEAHDPAARAQWQSSRDECVEAFRRIFAELRVEFDPGCWFFESTVDDTHLGQQTAAELKQRGIAVVDESEEYKGALFVDFAAHADSPVFRDDERKRIRQLGKMTILRSDGTSLYQTKELGLAKYKFDNFAIDESLYVVGSEQKLYFEQVFAILRLWGFPNAENCRHIAYELVVLPEGKMSSREGTVVSYRELRDEALARAEAVTREKGIVADEAKLRDTARAIAIAAIKYAMLQVGGNQQIVFDFEQALSFDGRAAPYLQYAYARAGRLVGNALRRGGHSAHPGAGQDPAPTNGGGGRVPAPPQLEPAETALARKLADWPAAAAEAARKYEPAVVASYLFELAGAFNDFYRDCRVLDAPAEIKPWRQDLTAAFREVMAIGFELLALPLPEAMRACLSRCRRRRRASSRSRWPASCSTGGASPAARSASTRRCGTCAAGASWTRRTSPRGWPPTRWRCSPPGSSPTAASWPTARSATRSSCAASAARTSCAGWCCSPSTQLNSTCRAPGW